MYRLSKIPEEHRSEIISDISDDKLYTFIVQDCSFNKIKRKDLAGVASSIADPTALSATYSVWGIYKNAHHATDVAWEGHYWNRSGFFKNIIDKNIPCILMHKVKNEWCPEIDTVVCFMTGECNDVFLVHPKDLTEWNPNEEINDV